MIGLGTCLLCGIMHSAQEGACSCVIWLGFPTHLQELPNPPSPLLYLLCSASFVCVDALATSSEAIAAAAAKVGPTQLNWCSISPSVSHAQVAAML